jgi:hypothetical protein
MRADGSSLPLDRVASASDRRRESDAAGAASFGEMITRIPIHVLSKRAEQLKQKAAANAAQVGTVTTVRAIFPDKDEVWLKKDFFRSTQRILHEHGTGTSA